MAGLVGAVLTIGLCALLGYIGRRSGVISQQGVGDLNRVVIYLAMPALLFGLLASADLTTIFSRSIVVIVITTCVTAVAITLLLALSRGGKKRPFMMAIFSSTYVNSNNIGLPVSLFVLGDISLVVPVILLQLLFLQPMLIALLERERGRGRSPFRVILAVILNPIMISSFGGVVVNLAGWTLPSALSEAISFAGQAAVPLALLAFGAAFPGAPILKEAQIRSMVWLIVFTKCVIMPVLAWFVGSMIFRMSQDAILAAVVMCLLPTSQGLLATSTVYGKDPAVVRDAVALTTLCFIPCLIVLILLIGS